MSTGSSSRKRDKFHRGISREKFEALTEKGLTQAGEFNSLTDFTQDVSGKFEKFKGRSPFSFRDDKRTDSQKLADRKRLEERRQKHEEERKAFFADVTQDQLKTLVTRFRQRQSSLVRQEQIQGRKQLILTDR